MAGGEALPLVGRTPKAWAPLLLGLRTGFCGSLTSFSSWNQAVVALLVTHSKWREAERSGIRVFVSELALERATYSAVLTRSPLYSLSSYPLHSRGALKTLHNTAFPP
jgi:hypothetical protein